MASAVAVTAFVRGGSNASPTGVASGSDGGSFAVASSGGSPAAEAEFPVAEAGEVTKSSSLDGSAGGSSSGLEFPATAGPTGRSTKTMLLHFGHVRI